MSYLPHQIEASDKAYKILSQKRVCLVAGLPRTGKTRTAIRVAELSQAKRVLVVTKKNAIEGWESELSKVDATKYYTITNYEQVPKLTGSYDFAIVDESHNIGRPPKPSARLKALRAKVLGLPVLLLTGTPASETRLSYYYQFSLSKWSPFAHFKNFYAFFAVYGIPQPIFVRGRAQETYKKAKPEIMAVLEPYIVTIDQDQAGIKYQAQDKAHIVTLSEATKRLIQAAQRDKVITIGNDEIALDSDIAERLAVHQIETGALLVDNEIVQLKNCEVMDYLQAHFKDSPAVGFMAHYRSTRQKLGHYFKKAQIFSSNAHAEGVDLSHLDHFVIVNSDYSGAKFIQRRERCTNINRTTPAIVHHIMTDGGISKNVYDTLSNKRDFTLSLYRASRDRTAITEEDT